MFYIRYTVTTKDGRKIDMARSYRNNQRAPKCPHKYKIEGNDLVSSVETAFCSGREKARIYRRGDHAAYEHLINKIERLSKGECE